MALTKEEVLNDFKESETDIVCLTSIVSNLKLFIFHSQEDRQSYRFDLMRYSSLLEEAQILHGRIKAKLKEFGVDA